MATLNSTDIGNLDKYIEQLMDCKPLGESEVKQLCEKVILSSNLSISYITG